MQASSKCKNGIILLWLYVYINKLEDWVCYIASALVVRQMGTRSVSEDEIGIPGRGYCSSVSACGIYVAREAHLSDTVGLDASRRHDNCAV